MSLIGAKPYTFVNGTTADAGQVNADFDFVASQVNTNVPLAITAAQAQYAGVNTQSGGYNLAMIDAGRVVEISAGSPTTVTIPADATINFPIGSWIDLAQLNSGQVTVVAAGGVTLRSLSSNVKLSAIYAVARIYKRAANDWVLSGNLSA